MGKWMENNTIWGWREIPENEQDPSSKRMENAKYMMDHEEYQEYVKALHAANDCEYQMELFKGKYAKKMEKVQDRILKDLETKKEKEIKDAAKKWKEYYEGQHLLACKSLKTELNAEKELNEKLLKIHKERSNSEREIRPKKEHSGYIFLSESEERVIAADGPIRAWKTVLQAPYKCTLAPISNVRTLIIGDLRKNVLREMGCRKISDDDVDMTTYKPNLKIESAYDEILSNFVYKHRIKINFATGFYEIQLFTVRPLSFSEKNIPGQGRKTGKPKKELEDE